jgi:hypothetical protein
MMINYQKSCGNDNGPVNESNITSFAKSEVEALPPEEIPTETDYKLGKDGKRRRNSKYLMDLPAGAPQNCQSQTIRSWVKTITLIST